MHISVILSTYNQPEWLTKTLWGYARQDLKPHEVLIADDGSTDETRSVIEDAQNGLGLNIQHVWHEDQGFRKTTILNRALQAASGVYLVFSDGDCVPRRDFLATHAAHAESGRFLSGGAVRLSLAGSCQITHSHVDSGECFRPGWASRHAGVSGAQKLKLLVPGWLPWLLDRATPTRATWNGGNASCWRQDALRVGGFDERMQYGGEDREFGERLVNLGLRPKQLRYRAVCLHLEHDRGYVEPGMAEKNHAIRSATRALGRTRTEHGLKQAG